MAYTISLNLSESIIEQARETARRTDRSLELVLAEWIERGSAEDNLINELVKTEHHLYTPLGGEDTAQALLEYLNSLEDRTGR
ncbi:MAG TPA: hypothetical protein VKQ72_22090 [Aggregatilineales bacterium]|nr:hypothetical protein [Aggregatilineales bacterium]